MCWVTTLMFLNNCICNSSFVVFELTMINMCVAGIDLSLFRHLFKDYSVIQANSSMSTLCQLYG